MVLEGDDGGPIVFDLGTGLRVWGESIDRSLPFEGTALLTHLHWDHVQGLPFFGPINDAGASLEIFGPGVSGECLCEAFSTFVNPPFFPIHYEMLHGDIRFHDILDLDFEVGPATVRCRPVPHVGLTNGYRVEWDGRSVAYVSDHQEPPDNPLHVADSVLELADGVDVLIHDAQFTREEFEKRANWGHCTVRYALEVAHQAKVRTLVLFHHDPSHHDDVMDELLAEAQEIAKDLNIKTVIAASEGLKLTLD